MNVLETILDFIVRLARVIFPCKKKTASCCPCPYPALPPASTDSTQVEGAEEAVAVAAV